MSERNLGFFKLNGYELVSLLTLAIVSVFAHLSFIKTTMFLGLSLTSWLLSLLALFIPIWNIIIAYSEDRKANSSLTKGVS